MNAKQPTLHDVARLAHVSHQTVSRVINNSPNVADETRLRVQDAIDNLKYRPNRAARSLITGRSQTLQVIDFDENYLAPIPLIISEARQHGYQVGVSTLRNPDSLDELQRIFDDLTSRIVDGFLLFALNTPIEPATLEKLCRGIPFVQLGGNPGQWMPAVVFDQRHGMQLLMEHLFDLGHRRIAEVSGSLEQHDGYIRHVAFLDLMNQHGLKPGPWLEGNFTAISGYIRTRELLQSGEEFTAIVCGNDNTALGALRAIHEFGLRVPDDISVVGFDDMELTDYFEPPLTTIRQGFAIQALLGIDYLINLIEKPETVHQIRVINPELILRNSTGPAAS